MNISYGACPVCGGVGINRFLQAKDHTVSGETFDIFYCNGCTAGFTQQVPDASSIGPYYQSAKYVSHSDTNEGFINALYHRVRDHTLRQKCKLIKQQSGKQNGHLLDIGAGTGAFVATMHSAGWKVAGLEPDETARAVALNKYGLALQTPDRLFTLDDGSFDVITLWHVLEHVHELHAYLDKFYTLLKPGGRLVAGVPNFTSKDAHHYGSYWAAYDVPRHLYHFSPLSMQLLMQQHGFSISDHKPMWFDSFYVSMLSEQYKTGQSNALRAVWNGFLSNLNALTDVKKCSSVIYVAKKSIDI